MIRVRSHCGKNSTLALLVLAAWWSIAGCVGREDRPPARTPENAAAERDMSGGAGARGGVDSSGAGADRLRDTIYLYVSPRGHDTNPGSRELPVATLARVHALLEQRSPEADVVVKVRSDAGIYLNQTVLWTYYRPDYSITIEADPSAMNACFEAGENPPVAPFFGLSAMRGEPTNITLRGLTVRNYLSRAVLFLGDRETRSNWNGRNSIERCVFEHIGNARAPARSIVYSAIGIVNSRKNRIVGCSFADIKNHTLANFPQETRGAARDLPPDVRESDRELRAIGPGSNPNIPIVCIYLAHYSDSNIVDSCEFKRIKGDPVRIRDDSNGNVIVNNYFELAGWNAIVSAWHCDAPRQNCAKEFGFETASTGNAVLRNTARGNWRGGPPRIFCDMRADGAPAAGVPASARIIRLEGNTLETYR